VKNRKVLKNIDIYTDGACSGNPGPGGWGAIIYYLEKETELSGFFENTTNNRMELTAAIKALEYFKEKSKINIYTDSNYLRMGITSWIDSWKKNNWRTSQKKKVKNVDLWRELDRLKEFHEIEWHWVKAHAGNKGNERADYLATNAISNRQSL
tara:strand:- start:37 stop:495 length:459 start_codon:yes stop_codon:yes gene_type:complete